ncbi:MAG: TIM barrel protein [Candidatus Thorarchaeota archaeon]
MTDVRFGPAGYPEGSKDTDTALDLLNKLGLNALEYEAVYGLRVNESGARAIGEAADRHRILMSMHAEYYISLVSKDPQIRARSRARLVRGLRLSPLMSVRRLVFHVGSYSGLTPEEAYPIVRDSLRSICEAIDADNKTLLCPETAGKTNAFGSLEEILRLCQDIDRCVPTIDWAHLYARNQGNLGAEDFARVLDTFERELGERFVNNMHFHVSGITFGDTGEREHRPMGGEWGPDVFPLVRLVVERGYSPTFISETPDPVTGAVYVKQLYHMIRESEE